MLVLRFSHLFFGALWVGMMAFQTFFLMPALAEVGPDSGKFMAAPIPMGLAFGSGGLADCSPSCWESS